MAFLGAGKVFMLINAAGRLAVDLDGNQWFGRNGAKAQGWYPNINGLGYPGSNAFMNQNWRLDNPQTDSAGNTFYSMKNVESGATLDVDGASRKVQGWQYLGGENQQWLFQPVPGGKTPLYTISPRYNYTANGKAGFVLDLPGGSSNNGIQLVVAPSIGNPGDSQEQTWMLVLCDH